MYKKPSTPSTWTLIRHGSFERAVRFSVDSPRPCDRVLDESGEALWSGRFANASAFRARVPVVPGNVSRLNQDGHVLSMIAEALEEYAAAKQRYLQRLDVDIYAVLPPGVGAQDVGHDGAKEAIEVGKEEEGTGESAEKTCRGYHEQHAAEDQLYQEKPVEDGRAGQRLGREAPDMVGEEQGRWTRPWCAARRSGRHGGIQEEDGKVRMAAAHGSKVRIPRPSTGFGRTIIIADQYLLLAATWIKVRTRRHLT